MKLIKNNLSHIKRCFIIGNGATLNQMDLDLIKNEITIGTNKIYLKFIPTYFCFADVGQFNTVKKDLESIKNTTFVLTMPKKEYSTISEEMKARSILIDTPRQLDKDGNFIWKDLLDPTIEAFDENFETFFISYSTVRDLCFPLAAFLGIKKIYLIGMDGFKNFQYKHFYPEGWIIYNKSLPKKTYRTDYSDYDKKIKAVCNNQGIQIYNCTLDAESTVFEKRNYLEVINEL